jgi:hypothetical protein
LGIPVFGFAVHNAFEKRWKVMNGEAEYAVILIRGRCSFLHFKELLSRSERMTEYFGME